jgi:hypothetical protein
MIAINGSRCDNAQQDTHNATAAEKDGFVRPETAALPASDPFPEEKDEVGTSPMASKVVDVEVVRKESAATQASQPKARAATEAKHPVEAFTTKAGFTLEEVSSVLVDEFETEPIKSWGEIPEDVAKKITGAQVGFLGLLGRRRAAANGGPK